MTRSNQLAGTQAESRDIVFLGREGKLFELNDLDCKVDFLESSALELDSLKGVKKWIQEVAWNIYMVERCWASIDKCWIINLDNYCQVTSKQQDQVTLKYITRKTSSSSSMSIKYWSTCEIDVFWNDNLLHIRSLFPL